MEYPEWKKAIHVLEESAFTDAQLAGYEKFWDIISVEKTLYNSAERKGMAVGMEKEQYLIAGNMKKQGITPDVIAQCTGLSLKVIDTL